MNKLFAIFIALLFLVNRPAMAENSKEAIATHAGKCQAVFEEMSRIHSVTAADIMYLGTIMGFESDGISKLAYRFAMLADHHAKDVTTIGDAFNK